MKITYKEIAAELARMKGEDYYAIQKYKQIYFEVRAKKFIKAANRVLRWKVATIKGDDNTLNNEK